MVRTLSKKKKGKQRGKIASRSKLKVSVLTYNKKIFSVNEQRQNQDRNFCSSLNNEVGFHIVYYHFDLARIAALNIFKKFF